MWLWILKVFLGWFFKNVISLRNKSIVTPFPEFFYISIMDGTCKHNFLTIPQLSIESIWYRIHGDPILIKMLPFQWSFLWVSSSMIILCNSITAWIIVNSFQCIIFHHNAWTQITYFTFCLITMFIVFSHY